MMENKVCAAIINKIQTTVDGGARITIDLGNDSTSMINQLFQKYMKGQYVVQVVFIDPELVENPVINIEVKNE